MDCRNSKIKQLLLEKKGTFENKNIEETETLRGLIGAITLLYGPQPWKCYRCQTRNLSECDTCVMCHMVKDQDVTIVPKLFGNDHVVKIFLPWGSKGDILAMRDVIRDFENENDKDKDKDTLISKLISMSSSIPYGTSSVLLSPLHVCAGFNLNALQDILEHSLLLNCLMMFERNSWGLPILNLAAALDHRNAFSLIFEHYIKHMPLEIQIYVIFSVAPIVFARNNPQLMVALLAFVLEMGLDMQNDAGDTIAHIIVRNKKKNKFVNHLRSELIRIGFIPSSDEFAQDKDFVNGMINMILHDSTVRLIQNKLGKTPLHVAVECNNLPMTIELLHNSDPTFREMRCKIKNQTALHIAARIGNVEIVKVLMDGASNRFLGMLDNDGRCVDIARSHLLNIKVRSFLKSCE
eukprot:TRINITY_DN2392_c0_g3_i2.p1 TRINITY_DN2392_c0_g3~~TRINITY_DN2392_c0_g3_i2.p1  ORF type:complete len:407 (+),score=58.37 TRINITY_DN2392_c0_g3_i2:1384-2604(+)